MATEVKISELKNNLSKYLRQVRRGGEVIVKDREEPIARITRYDALLISKPATRKPADLDKLPPIKLKRKITPQEFEEVLRWVKRDRV